MRTSSIIHAIMTIAAAAFLMAAAPSVAHAQAGTAQRNAEMSRMYDKIIRNFGKPWTLASIDSMRVMAIKAGDHEGELRALSLIVKYESRSSYNADKVEVAADRLMDKARKYGNIEYFYSGASLLVTYLTNRAYYSEALAYQDKIIAYAKKHGHTYGIILGHVALGNIQRKRMHMVQAIDEYNTAISLYKRNNIKHDYGSDYKRIVECCIMAYNFPKAISEADKGIAVTRSYKSMAGLLGYKAFAQFMLGRDAEFLESYYAYRSYMSKHPDIMPFVANSLDVMKLIHDKNYAEVEKRLATPSMGAFASFVKIAYNKRRQHYPDVLEQMRLLNIMLYGESKGSFAADWARMSGSIINNMTAIEKERAAGENSRLELARTNLQLKNNELELFRLKDAENLALTSAEAKRLTLNNQSMLSRQLRDSLNNQQLHRQAQEQEQRSSRISFWILYGVIAFLTLLAYLYLLRNRKMAHLLKRTNENLRMTLDDLSVANDHAQESDRKKTEFIQNMSHEIRTPLNAIVGFSQVLADSDDSIGDDERLYMERVINHNSGVLNNMINDILDLTSLESGKYVMKREAVSVNRLCHHAIDLTLDSKAEGVSLRFETELPDDFTIKTDEYRVCQVLTNLLSNAMKNTSHGSIVLACSLTERMGMITFSVTDTGIGVPRDKQGAIFDRFCKLDQFKQGAGLGLDICRIIAGKLGGSIDINHDYAEGARFWFAIPI